MNNFKPKVSVLMITYNHEQYVEQAIRSVMMQETDFDYELIIGEDCSTDRTREIVLRIKKEYPDRIKILLQEQNVGMIQNLADVYHAAQGEFLALLEGDDYWTSPRKLQIQSEYLDKHPNCSLCFHSAIVVFEGENSRRSYTIAPPPFHVVSFENWMLHRSQQRSYIATASLFFRCPYEQIPAWFYHLKAAGDWPLVVWIMCRGGTLDFINSAKPMSAYRKHPGGVTQKNSVKGSKIRLRRLEEDLQDHFHVIRQLDRRQKKWLCFRIQQLHMAIATEHIANGSFLRVVSHIFRALQFAPTLSRAQVMELLKTYLYFHKPNMLLFLRSCKHFFGVTS